MCIRDSVYILFFLIRGATVCTSRRATLCTSGIPRCNFRTSGNRWNPAIFQTCNFCTSSIGVLIAGRPAQTIRPRIHVRILFQRLQSHPHVQVPHDRPMLWRKIPATLVITSQRLVPPADRPRLLQRMQTRDHRPPRTMRLSGQNLHTRPTTRPIRPRTIRQRHQHKPRIRSRRRSLPQRPTTRLPTHFYITPAFPAR